MERYTYKEETMKALADEVRNITFTQEPLNIKDMIEELHTREPQIEFVEFNTKPYVREGANWFQHINGNYLFMVAGSVSCGTYKELTIETLRTNFTPSSDDDVLKDSDDILNYYDNNKSLFKIAGTQEETFSKNRQSAPYRYGLTATEADKRKAYYFVILAKDSEGTVVARKAYSVPSIIQP